MELPRSPLVEKLLSNPVTRKKLSRLAWSGGGVIPATDTTPEVVVSVIGVSCGVKDNGGKNMRVTRVTDDWLDSQIKFYEQKTGCKRGSMKHDKWRTMAFILSALSELRELRASLHEHGGKAHE